MGNIISFEKKTEIEFKETFESVPSPSACRTDTNIVKNKAPWTLQQAEAAESEYFELKLAILNQREKSGKRFIYQDREFPPETSSLCYTASSPPNWENIKWKRPSDLSKNPRLLTDGINSEDIVQGRLGNCWWLASCAAISHSIKHMKRIIPLDQQISGSDYFGMVHFRFWRYGKWVDVIVDDNLPAINGILCFGRSSDKNEFWLPLLEKAYAKLHGSYQAIEGGFTQDGMEDLTGGIAINYSIEEIPPKHLLKILHKASSKESFVCTTLQGSTNTVDENSGLVLSHAYSVLKVTRITYESRTLDLMKLRNPWGGSTEWKGAWSDRSPLWNSLNDSVKQSLGYADKENGEWWMSFDDFIQHFTDLTVCAIGPDFDEDGAPCGDKWVLSTINGKWIPGKSAGGSQGNMDSYVTNPQYFLHLKELDDYDPCEETPSDEDKCSLLVGLMQEYGTIRKAEKTENRYISLSIYKVSQPPETKLDMQHCYHAKKVATTGLHDNRREVTLTAELHPGFYVIVPSCFAIGKGGNFFIRICTEKNVDIHELGTL